MRRALLAFAAAFVLSLSLAVPANATYLGYTMCTPNGLPALHAYAWKHQRADGYSRWIRPWATPLHTKGTNYVFTYFTFDDAYPRGYQHPYYGWFLGDYHKLTANWVSENGRRASCVMGLW